MNEQYNYKAKSLRGISQNDRLNINLPPDTFKIDDRELHDILGNTHAFAEFLQYYNELNNTNGDWKCFWEADPLAFLAIICSIDINSLHDNYWQLHRNYLTLPEEEIDETSEILHGDKLIAKIRNIARQIEDFYRLLPESLSLKQEILSYIVKDRITDTEQLSGALHTLIGFHKEVYPQTLEEPKDLNHSQYAVFFSEQWEITNAQAFYKIPFKTGYRENGFENLHELFNEFLKALKKIKTRALYWFNKDINNPEVTEPHIALFLAFLKLFGFVREDLNKLTKNHLEHYYKKILHLQEQDAVPDHVYLLFELANNIDEFNVTTDHALLGGKDSNNTPLLYKPIEDWVIGKATVENIKNTAIGGSLYKLLVNPDISKAYSKHEELPNQEAESWRGFGDNMQLPYGEIGFAIASPQLILREGVRKISLTIPLDEDVLNNLFRKPDLFSIYLTTKDGWTEISPRETFAGSGYAIHEDNSIILSINIPPNFDAIVGPKEKVLGSVWPALKLTLNSKHSDFYQAYTILKSQFPEKIFLYVEANAIKENLIIQSDHGLFNGTQQFYPFGPIPELENNFYIGSTEIFQKRLDNLYINFNWIDAPTAFTEYYKEYGVINFESPILDLDILTNSRFPEQILKARPEIDIKVLPKPYLWGRITDETELFPISGIQVNLSDGIEGGININTYTNSNGIYRFHTQDLEDVGSFTLSIHHEHYFVLNISDEDGVYNAQLSRRGTYSSLIESDAIISQIALRDLNTFRDTKNQLFTKYDGNISNGFIRIKLKEKDFLHKEYSKVLALKTIEASKENNCSNALNALYEYLKETEDGNLTAEEIRATIEANPGVDLPNIPYTPCTNGINVSYTGTITIETGKNSDGIDQFYQLLPFNGYKELKISDKSFINLPLVYNYKAYDKMLAKDSTGNLYIGLKNLKPGGSLSLLIHLQDGSELNPKLQAPDIQWSYLTKNNNWSPFAAHQFLKDTSMGFTRTGIVQLLIPYDIVDQTTLFSEQLYWLRIAAIEDENYNPVKSIQALPNIIDIKAQAIEAKFTNNNNTLEHLANPLPADTISKLQTSRSEVKKIEQPHPSTGGKLPEKGNEFYKRVSERLRHKDRAVTSWDYERILLKKYPEIKRTKCLNHSKPGNNIVPGNVLMTVIPDLSVRNGNTSSQPRFPKGDLRMMEQFMQKKTNLFVAHTKTDNLGNIEEQNLFIENPNYETIRLWVDIKFKKGLDIEYYKFELDKEITNLLSPWLENSEYDISFSQPLYRSKIIHFLEELSYIDKITNMYVFHNNAMVPEFMEKIVPLTNRSIFTSYIKEDANNPFTTNHIIEPVTDIAEVNCI